MGSASSCAIPVQAASGNNGNVMGYAYLDNQTTLSPNLGHTAAYAYDALNRLTNAQASGSVSYDLPFSYTADGSNGRYGNVTCVINGNTSGFCPTYSFNSANNQITNSGYTYDAAGDQLSDSSYTYQYDAEGHITTMLQGGSTYAEFVYNARGQAVETTYPVYSNTEVVGVFGPAGQELGYYDGGSGDWYDRDIWAAGRMVAQSYAADTYFLHANALHSDTQITDYSGAVQTDFVYYPWQMWEHSGLMVDAHFAGFQQSGGQNYPTPTRTYSSPDGRWLTPDPAGKAAVDLSNPQSWNAYAYALNNPTTNADPTGLYAHDCGSLGDKACAQRIKQIDTDVARWAKSKDAAERDIAKTLGTSKDTNNGVTITFVKDFRDSKGNVIPDKQGDTNGLFAAGQFTADGKFVPDIQIRLKGSLSGDDLAGTLVHEGSHAVDRILFESSCTISGCNQGLNPTGRETEQKAYGVEYNYWRSVGQGSQHSYIGSQRQIDIFVGLHPEVYPLSYLNNPIFPSNL